MGEAAVAGIVLEVGVPRGIGVITAYANRSARYVNFAGASVVWDRPTDALDARIDALLSAATEVAAGAAVIDLHELDAVPPTTT